MQGRQAVQPPHQGGQAGFAVEAARLRRQGLQQDDRAVDPGLGVGGAALGRELKINALILGLAAEAALGLDRAEDQDRKQGHGHGQTHAKANALDARAAQLAPPRAAEPQHASVPPGAAQPVGVGQNRAHGVAGGLTVAAIAATLKRGLQGLAGA